MVPGRPHTSIIKKRREKFDTAVDPAGRHSTHIRKDTLMKYMLLIYHEEGAISDQERQHCYEESTQLCHELQSKGQFVSASPLHPTSMATSVRIRDDKRIVTDGAFAETREYLGGYFMVNAKDLDEAIAIAARIPAARFGTVEVRPVIELAGLPEPAAAAELVEQTA